MRPDHPKPFYYLDNFHLLLDWVAERYADLLDAEERDFLSRFPALPQPAQALLVRMVMRRGELFRVGKLVYSEIGAISAALAPLVEAGWIEAEPALELDALFGLLTRPEIDAAFAASQPRPQERKAELLARLQPQFEAPRTFAQWCPDLADAACRLAIRPLCDRLRLIFFGNLQQDWSEFVLADLGIFQYEQVPFSAESRGFRCRADLDFYLQLHDCRRRLDEGEAAESVGQAVLALHSEQDWLARRRAKLLFALAQQHERQARFDEALALYRQCAYPGARARQIRVLERQEAAETAQALASAAWIEPESEAEHQQLARMLPRLCRRLGLPLPARPELPAIPEQLLRLPRPQDGYPVEFAVRDHLHTAEGPVRYVENTLLNGLFGLLCWPAVFAPLPGAFFHPFHQGPADLLSPDFHARRRDLFDACLAELDDGRYRATIARCFEEKQGIQSPFVAWQVLDAELLQLALHCIPAAHLAYFFRRILDDVRSNRAGLPDLIRFLPAQAGYQLIEVKGPGDRLQDNQLRWLHGCLERGIPVGVCYVEWDAP